MTDIDISYHIDKKSCRPRKSAASQRALRYAVRGAAARTSALITMFAVQTSGMHCACVHTKCRHALRMRSHELESDARFCCKSPPPPPPPMSLTLSSKCTLIFFFKDQSVTSNWRQHHFFTHNYKFKDPVWPSVCLFLSIKLPPKGSSLPVCVVPSAWKHSPAIC